MYIRFSEGIFEGVSQAVRRLHFIGFCIAQPDLGQPLTKSSRGAVAAAVPAVPGKDWIGRFARSRNPHAQSLKGLFIHDRYNPDGLLVLQASEGIVTQGDRASRAVNVPNLQSADLAQSCARAGEEPDDFLQLIVDGQTTTEIASTLHLGVRTVESYRFNILLKLNVKNTATLVKKAVELGLVR